MEMTQVYTEIDQNTGTEYRYDIIVDIDNIKGIPEPIYSRMRDWINTHYANPRYSCAGFFYYLTHGPDQLLDIAKNTHIIPSLEPNDYVYLSQLHCKDGIHTQEGDVYPFHYAIFIKDLGLYVSQFGNGGPIVLCDLAAMHAYFDTTTLTYIRSLEILTT